MERLQLHRIRKRLINDKHINKVTSGEGSSSTVDSPKPKQDETASEIIIPSGPCTPKRSESNFPHDYYSRFFPATQEGCGDNIIWDWGSPIRRNGENNRKVSDPGTPKRRSSIDHKKRMSNSPLMYKPVKRQIMNKENSDGIAKFKADMLAVSEQLKNAQKTEEVPNLTNASASDNRVTDEQIDIPEELDFSEFSDCDRDLEITLGPEEVPIRQVNHKEENNIDDLFDNSLNDEVMIRCSQEIEERLNIVPLDSNKRKSNSSLDNGNDKNYLCKGNSSILSRTNKIEAPSISNMSERDTVKKLPEKQCVKNGTIPKKSASSIVAKNNNGMSHSTTRVSTSRSPITKYKSDPIRPKTPISTATSSIKNDQQAVKSTDITELFDFDDFDIPDDSFDDCLVTHKINVGVDHKNSYSSTSNNSKSVEISKNPTFPLSSHTAPTKNVGAQKQHFSGQVNASNKSSTFVKHVPSSRPVPATVVTSAALNQNRKFFKSKSNSHSSFSNNESKNISSSLNSCSKRTIAGSSVSSQNQQIHRTSSCQDSERSKIKPNFIDNPIMSHPNRSERKDDGDSCKLGAVPQSSDMSSGLQSLQLCTAEEIERKRLEAKMKLEARKKRLQMNSRLKSFPMKSSMSQSKIQNNR